MAKGEKREKFFERVYVDSTGEGSIAMDDATVFEADFSEVHGAAGIVFPSAAGSALMRYCMDVLVNVGNAVLKAEGGTLEGAVEKIKATWESLTGGTFRFRNASGSGAGLSQEEEFAVIAGVIFNLGKAKDLDTALAQVKAIHAITKTNAKGHTQRPSYTTLRNVPEVRLALAQAENANSNLDSILASVQ